jgi:hypothetical protein
LRNASGARPLVSGERSAVMSWAISWPKNGHPAASVASSGALSALSLAACGGFEAPVAAAHIPPTPPARIS